VRVRPLADQWAGNQQDIERRIRALETQQNSYVTDAVGNVVMQTGYIAGTIPAQLGTLVSDDSGNPRLQFGLLPDGNYGIAVYDLDNDGNYIQVQAPSQGSWSTEFDTTSESWIYNGTSGPATTVQVGQSGRALVIASAIIGIDGGIDQTVYWQGLIGVSPGAASAATGIASMSVSPLPGGSEVTPSIQSTACGSALFSGLTPGPVTFTMAYMSANGQTVRFTGSNLVVIPY
jgi:hypothetical protein